MAKLPDWADSLLNIQQSMRAEQISREVAANARQINTLEKHLSELDEKIGSARRDRARQAALLEMLFAYRQIVDRAADEKNAFASYVNLKAGEPYIEEVDTADIQELNDKEYHAETANRLHRALATLQKSLGTTVFASFESLYRGLCEIDQLGKQLSAEKMRREGMLTEDHPQYVEITYLLEEVKRGADGSPTFGSDVMRLAGMIEAARSLAAQLPDFSWDATEYGKHLDAMLIGLVRPHRRSVFLLKCMVLLAKCDGAVSPTERGFMVTTADKFALTAKEADELIRETSKVHRSEFDCTAEEGANILHWLYRCATTDGLVSPAEKLMLDRMRKALGVPAASIVTAAQPATGDEKIIFLDTDAAISLLRTKPLKDVWAWDGAPPEVVARVSQQLAISAEERPLAVFSRKSWILSGGRRTISSAVLTDRMLYVTGFPSFADIKAGQVPVARIRHDEIERAGGFAFVGVTLKNGQKVKTDRAMGEFLELVDQVMKTCQRSA